LARLLFKHQIKIKKIGKILREKNATQSREKG